MFIWCDLISALTSCSENSPFGAVNGVLLVHRCILLKKKDITLLIYSITCSMYDCLAWIEVLRVVVGVLHLRVILQYRSSDSNGELVGANWDSSPKLQKREITWFGKMSQRRVGHVETWPDD